MKKFKVGDIVARKSYGRDMYFKVSEIKNGGRENICTLKGIYYRIQADANESDLVPLSVEEVREYMHSSEATACAKHC